MSALSLALISGYGNPGVRRFCLCLEAPLINKRKVRTISGKILFCFSFLIFLTGNESAVLSRQAATVGPEKGWLVLHGGGTKREYGAMHRFAALAGGQNASVVVVLTPVDLEVITPGFLTQYKQWWATELGVTNVSFLDTRNRKEAETEAFVAPLRNATGVWILGGHNNNLVDIYLGTLTEREIKTVAERGGVVGGSSAGAMIQGSFLITRDDSSTGATSSRNLDKTRLAGFGLLRDVTVYPHLSARHAEKMMLDIMAHYPELLGIGIDESTAIVVHGDQFEVIGDGKVGIFKGDKRAGKKYMYLSKGQRFDLKKCIIIK